jgi:hypothetical protein
MNKITTEDYTNIAKEVIKDSLREKNYVDIHFIAEKMGKSLDFSFAQARRFLSEQNLVYHVVGFTQPEEKMYVTAEEYLSGNNLGSKLEGAKLAAETNPEYNIYVERLEEEITRRLENKLEIAKLAAGTNPEYKKYIESLEGEIAQRKESKNPPINFTVTRHIGQTFSVERGDVSKEYELLRGSDKEAEVAAQIAEDFNISVEEGAELFEEATNQNAVENEVKHQSIEQEKEEIIGKLLDDIQNGEPEEYGYAAGLAEIEDDFDV